MFWISIILLALLSGCAAIKPDAIRCEFLHASHLSAPPDEEDSLDIAQCAGHYELTERSYIDVGCGVKLRDAGFYGPGDVCTIRTGVEWDLK